MNAHEVVAHAIAHPADHKLTGRDELVRSNNLLWGMWCGTDYLCGQCDILLAVDSSMRIMTWDHYRGAVPYTRNDFVHMGPINV